MIMRPAETPHCTKHDRFQLQQLLDDHLPAHESSRWLEHLSDCSVCQISLQMLASQPDAWDETRVALKTALLETQAVEPKSNERMMIAWLDPSEEADSLGRLGNYEVRRVVGHGGMGIVFEGWDRALHRIVAIKAMHPHLAAIGVARQRFIREARAAAAIVHPHVVPIYCVDAQHQPPYLVMPLVGGETLQTRIDREGAMSVEAALRIAYQIADGLSAAHAQGLVHRDVKPSNILLEHGTERALLTDFGVARALDDASVTASGTISGTPEYMSPEQTRGESIDARSDLFSLGTVLYSMLSGRNPFRAESPLAVLRRVHEDRPRPLMEIQSQVPVWLQQIVERLHAKRPEYRYESAAEVANLLRSCLAHVHQPQHCELPSALQKTEASNSSRIVRFLGAIGIVSLLVLGIVAGKLLGPTMATQAKMAPALSTPEIETDDSLPEYLKPLQDQWEPWDSLLDSIESDIQKITKP